MLLPYIVEDKEFFAKVGMNACVLHALKSRLIIIIFISTWKVSRAWFTMNVMSKLKFLNFYKKIRLLFIV